MKEFKGTKGKWHLVEYAGYFNIQSGMYYGDDNILDRDAVGSEIAEANAKLAVSAPDLLEALQDVREELLEEGFSKKGYTILNIDRAINKALGE